MPLAVVGYVLLGSSRHLYVGPSASTSSAEYIALTVALTLMVGVIYIAGGLARMGFIARFSHARCSCLQATVLGAGPY